ncbi:hypothetical protein [Mycobacterium asiaticum]|uniref:hypothetical protein n=1 Tax=Mycobacterium asiaticum TaxID=1790 RepID=UPI000B1473E6|nr:hypothetical protein [Mycobacterium asiaticum]
MITMITVTDATVFGVSPATRLPNAHAAAALAAAGKHRVAAATEASVNRGST